MKKALCLISLTITTLILLAACQPEPAEPSCATPTAGLAQECAAVEQRILAATVRLELFHGPNGGRGHGTVIGGRYLVTHNHYPLSVATLASGEQNSAMAVSVFKADGDIILLEAPLSVFTVVAKYLQTLVLDFKEYGGVGFFDSVGVPSAEFKAWDSLPLQPGMEVAQVDWDGSTAAVNWVKINSIVTVDGIPALELASFVTQGASGGGVFWNGFYIANNWSRATELPQDSEAILRQYSVAALDTLIPALTSQMDHSFPPESIEVFTP